MSVNVRTADGEAMIDAKALERFRAALAGTLLASASPGYDDARTVWMR
jgi:hypothetical protein